MKVLHLIDGLGLGGAQVVLKNLLEAQPNNLDVYIYALRTQKAHIQIDHKNIHIYPSSAKYSFAPISALRQFIEKHEITVLHCHLFRSQVTGWLLKKIYCPDIKLVFHEHGPIFRNFAPWIIDQMLVGLLKISRQDVFRYVAISEATKQRLIERAKLEPSKISTVLNAVNLDRFSPKNKITHPKLTPFQHQTKFTVGYVGRLSTVKGCRYLIEAMALLDFEAQLLIVGEGELYHELKQLVSQLELQNKVTFLGYIDTPEQAYLLFDVLVVPSLREAFGNIIIEAQSTETPVIATNTAGPSEIITDEKNGLLCAPENASEIAKKIQVIYHNLSLKQQIIRTGKDEITKYSTQVFVEKINQLYIKINNKIG